MRTSEAGVRLIKKHEGYRGRPYFCPAGKPTIGYGATFYPDGRPVSMTDPAISEAEASRILVDMLGEFEAAVDRLVTVPITQHEFDALVSFAYNLGPTQLASSTLLRKLNAGDKAGAADQFLRWDKSAGKTLAGLTRRRQEERALFLGGDLA